MCRVIAVEGLKAIFGFCADFEVRFTLIGWFLRWVYDCGVNYG